MGDLELDLVILSVGRSRGTYPPHPGMPMVVKYFHGEQTPGSKGLSNLTVKGSTRITLKLDKFNLEISQNFSK